MAGEGGHLGVRLLCALLVVACPAAAHAGTDLAALEAEWGEAQRTLLRLRAEAAVLKGEKDLLPPQGPTGPGVPAALRARLAGVLSRSGLLRQAGAWKQAVGELDRREVGPELARAEAAWALAAQRELEVRRRWAEAEALRGAPPGRPPSLLPAGLARVRRTLWAAAAGGVGLLLAVSEVRRAPRRRRASPAGRAAWLTLGALLACVVVRQAATLRAASQPLLGGRPGAQAAEDYRRDLENEAAALQDDLDDQRRENEAVRRQIDAGRAKVEAAWAAQLGFPDGPAFRARAGDLVGDLHPLLVRARLAVLTAEDAARRAAEAGPRQREIEEALEGSDVVVRQRAAAAAGLYLAAALAAGAPWVAARWRRRGAGPRCPQCGGRLRTARGTGGLREVACAACAYRFPAVYRALPRLSFPLLGLGGSGKTLWLLELHRLLGGRNLPAPCDLIDSEGNRRLEGQADALARLGQPPGTTRQSSGLDCPLLFHLRGGGPGALVHLFDLPGAFADRPRGDPLRLRVLRMDGVVFFLDPTWPRHRELPTPYPQRRALERCVAELRQAHGVAAGRLIPVPVAVCLGKLDLAPTQSLFETASLEWLDRLRDTERERPSLDLLRRRSDLVREALPVLFPGWNVPGVLEGHFGDNVLYFPTAAAGLDDNDTLLGLGRGADSLRDRATSFGVAEPVLWLLHAHGYRVFG